MQKWVHSNSNDSHSYDLSSDRCRTVVPLRRQPASFADALDAAAGDETDGKLLHSSWPGTVGERHPHWLSTPAKEQKEKQRLDGRAEPRSLEASSPDEPLSPSSLRLSRASSSCDSSDTGWYLEDGCASDLSADADSPISEEEGEEEDSDFLFVPQGSGSYQISQLKSIQEILRESGSGSSVYFSSSLPSNGRCLYPILEESSDEISDPTATDSEDDGSAVFLPATEGDEILQLCHMTTDDKATSKEFPVNIKDRSRSSSSVSTSSSTCSSESSEVSIDLEQQQQQPHQLQQLQTVEDMRRWSLMRQPQQLDAIEEAESAASSSASSSDIEEAPEFNTVSYSTNQAEENTALVKRSADTILAATAVSAQVHVVASSRAQVRDSSGQLTGDEASAITEATGASVNVAVARAAARAASIATSTVVRNGCGLGHYRILISTQCDVEHQLGAPVGDGDVNDGWCRPIEDSQAEPAATNPTASGEHILKLLPISNQNTPGSAGQGTYTVVTEDQLLVKSSEACTPQTEATVESAYIPSSGDEGSGSETDDDDTTDSENFQTSESDSSVAPQWAELHAQAAVYRSVLQQQFSVKDAKSAPQANQPNTFNRLQADQERLRRAKEACLSGQNSLREQLLDRVQYQPIYRSQQTEIQKRRNDRHESQGLVATPGSHSLREILDDNLVRKSQGQERKILGCRSTDLDKLDDLDCNQAPQGGVVMSALETQPGQFNSVSLFDLSRSTIASDGLRANSFSSSLMETNIDTGEETHHSIVKETDLDTLQQPVMFQSPGSVKRRSQSLLNLTGQVDSKDRESAAEVGAGNSISRSSSQRKSKKRKRKSFIEQLEERAKSDPEKEICRSLSRLRIPAWMDRMQLNGFNTSAPENGGKYSRHRQQANKFSMSVNDLGVSAAEAAIQAPEKERDESVLDPPVKFEEGFLNPVIFPTSMSLPCLLAVRTQETPSAVAIDQLDQVAPENTSRKPNKTRSQLFREAQELRRKRLIEMQSQMHRPPLDPVTLTPKDFLPRKSVEKTQTDDRSKVEQPSSARAKALAIAAASIAACSHLSQPRESDWIPGPPPRPKTMPQPSSHSTDISEKRPTNNSLDVPPPLPPRSKVAQGFPGRAAGPEIAGTKQSSQTSCELRPAPVASPQKPPPPPPPRSQIGLVQPSRIESSAESTISSDVVSATEDEIPPPLPKRMSKNFPENGISKTDATQGERKSNQESAYESNEPPGISGELHRHHSNIQKILFEHTQKSDSLTHRHAESSIVQTLSISQLSDSDEPSEHAKIDSNHPKEHMLNDSDQTNEYSSNDSNHPKEHTLNDSDQTNEYTANDSNHPNEHTLNDSDQTNEYTANDSDQTNEYTENDSNHPNEHKLNDSDQTNEYTANDSDQTNEYTENDSDQTNEYTANDSDQTNEYTANDSDQTNEWTANDSNHPNERTLNDSDQTNEYTANDFDQTGFTTDQLHASSPQSYGWQPEFAPLFQQQFQSSDGHANLNGTASNCHSSTSNSIKNEGRESPRNDQECVEELKSSTPSSQTDSDRTVEESTVVQASVVYRRVVRQTIEFSSGKSRKGESNSSVADLRDSVFDSMSSSHIDVEIPADTQRAMLALIESQLDQFEESLAELEKGGFHRVGSYAEMIAALEAARDGSVLAGLALTNFPEDNTTGTRDICHCVLVDWLLRRPETHRRLARLAQASHRCLGRGCVLLAFELDNNSALFYLQKPPVYAPLDELNEAPGFSASANLLKACAAYNPEDEFVVCLAAAGSRLCASLRAEPQLALTPHPKERRQAFVTSLRRSLRDRGVSLRHHYPELHDLLELYADTGEAFQPVTIRPVDAVSGRTFACSIAVPSSPDGDWWTSEHLLGDQHSDDQRSDGGKKQARTKKVISTAL